MPRRYRLGKLPQDRCVPQAELQAGPWQCPVQSCRLVQVPWSVQPLPYRTLRAADGRLSEGWLSGAGDRLWHEPAAGLWGLVGLLLFWQGTEAACACLGCGVEVAAEAGQRSVGSEVRRLTGYAVTVTAGAHLICRPLLRLQVLLSYASAKSAAHPMRGPRLRYRGMPRPISR